MPCYGGGDPVEIRELEDTIEKFEAVLCGIMRVDPSIVNRIDWKEVGITKQQHMNWWKEHQREDAARKMHEAKANQLRKERQEKARVARLAKLRKELAEAEAEDAKKKASEEESRQA